MQHSEGDFELPERDYSPSACINTLSHGVHRYDHTKEAAKDSSLQKC